MIRWTRITLYEVQSSLLDKHLIQLITHQNNVECEEHHSDQCSFKPSMVWCLSIRIIQPPKLTTRQFLYVSLITAFIRSRNLFLSRAK